LSSVGKKGPQQHILKEPRVCLRWNASRTTGCVFAGNKQFTAGSSWISLSLFRCSPEFRRRSAAILLPSTMAMFVRRPAD